MWTSEHVLFHVPLDEGLSVLASYAARTERVRVGTAVLLLAPIWIGGRSEAAMRLTARVGDGYLPYLVTPGRFRDGFAKVRAWAADHARDAARIEPALHLFTALGATRETARAYAAQELSHRYHQPFDAIVDRHCALGPPAECAATIARFADDVERLARDVVPAVHHS